jgi:DedD protein
MGLLQSLFARSRDADADRPAAAADEVQQARTRARRRLIGAVLLLGVGVIGFPLLFETQPRPIPVDIPIQIPRKDGQPPLALPPPKSAAVAPAAPSAPAAKPVITESAADAGKEVNVAADTAAAPAASKPVAAAPTPAPAPSAEAARAKALLEGAPVAKADEGKGRFVVQVGAYADAAAAREARGRLERMGMKTYTQVVDTDAGKRIRVRVGPFASRDDAARAAERIKSAGLPTAVLAL